MSLLSIVVALVLVVLGGWILYRQLDNLLGPARGPITVGEFQVDGTAQAALRKQLLVRLAELQDPTPLQVESAFREVATLDALKLFKEMQAPSATEPPEIRIQGVDVTALVKTARTLAAAPAWKVDGELVHRTDSILMTLNLWHGSKRVKRWVLSRGATTEAERKTATEQLMDDALFELLLDQQQHARHRGAEATTESLGSFERAFGRKASLDDLPNARALGAYMTGRAALARYYRLGEPHLLNASVNALLRLQSEAPEFGKGLLLLGMALAESRREHEAIQIYEQLLALVDADDENDLAVLNIRLLKTMARIKLYTPRASSEALGELKELLECVPASAASADGGELTPSALQRIELRGQIHAQMATALGLYLAYFRHGSVAAQFPYGHVKDWDKEKREAFDKAVETHDWATYETLAQAGVAALDEQIRTSLAHAIEALQELGAGAAKPKDNRAEADSPPMAPVQAMATEPPAEVPLPDNASVRAVHQEIEFQVALAWGYRRYRLAALLTPEPSDASSEDGEFTEACKQSIAQLRKAEARRPNHYLVLEYLGLIYADPRFDPAATHLDLAQRYLTRAIASKPADYYGNLLLARLLLRRVSVRGLVAESAPLLEQALAAQSAAITTRESQGYLLVLRAELLFMQREIEPDDKKRAALLAQIEADLDQAQPLSGRDGAYAFLRALVATRRFDQLAAALVKALAEATAKGTLKADEKEAADARFEEAQEALLVTIDEVSVRCDQVTPPPIAVEIRRTLADLKRKAERLRSAVEVATLTDYRPIRIPIALPESGHRAR